MLHGMTPAQKIRLGFDLFLAKARDKHEERFLYDRSSWKGTNKKVRIFCGLHGWFEQVADDHWKHSGCEACARWEMSQRKKRRGWAKFFAAVQLKYGSRFEYDKRSWIHSGEKIRIHCILHGWFSQIAYDHLRLQGCRHCSSNKAPRRLDLKEVICRFRKTHGNRYGYSKVVYKGMGKKVVIICQKHGDFRQTPQEHAGGGGCQKCSGRHRWTTSEFIERATAKHAGRYAYERAEYKSALTPITVTCSVHGDFQTQPARHVLQGHGCPSCNPVRLRTQSEFLTSARARFGDRYDYSKAVYVNAVTPMSIGCPVHGVFQQSPTYHLNSAIGCQKCTVNVSIKETAWLDHLHLPDTTRRQAKIQLDGRLRSVDAWDPETKTVYEFWGDWWHGHPSRFAPNDVHPRAKVAYKTLYRQTQEKRRAIAAAGYRLVEIWEHEYDAQVMAGTLPPPPSRRHAPRLPRRRNA